LSVDGKKVLHMDKNDYYGGESASLNLQQLFEKCGREGKPDEAKFGRIRDYNVDIVPKLIMATGKLVKILLHTDVTRYLEFKVVDGSFVYKKGKLHKVPVTETEGLTSGLVGLLDKNRLRQFLGFCNELDFDDPKTHKGFDLNKVPFREVLKYYKLGQDVADVVGHACALYQNDDFMDRPARECLERMALYADSLAQYGKSPYIYALYGLGELPQSFARLAAIYGGTYMLNKKFEGLTFDDNGAVNGVKADGETVKAPIVIGDPSYFQECNKVEKIGQVARCICILSHPIEGTKNAESCQIIIPAHQVNRKNDLYVCMISGAHCVAPQGKHIAIVSSTVETGNPEKELAPGLALLGEIDDKFLLVSDLYGPTNDSSKDKCYISTSYDASSHFESACQNISELYKSITGKDIDLTPKKKDDENENNA